ncbi:MAG: hypothetical protein KVP17_001885 [Porospora cf. gigantea B]|uniref:uncharacterized protein n=1 Tax=Porospora cf. gigantea B TaxID=2853592 RepID=UPI00357199F6|nr:MAG: hypothetical protein KVP17_001885 [Porospora cf. gigantea B]
MDRLADACLPLLPRHLIEHTIPCTKNSYAVSPRHWCACPSNGPKLTIKDVLREIPTNLKDVLKMTDTSPQWKQVLSEDYSKTVERLELPTLLALLNKIPTTLQEPMFIDKNVRVESLENSAPAYGSTQMDATLTTDGRQMSLRVLPLEEAACCQELPEERIQRGTVTINTGPPSVALGVAPREWRSKVHFLWSINHTFCREPLRMFGLFLAYPRTVIFSRLASLPGQSTTATSSWSEANGLGLAVDNSRGRYMIRYNSGSVTEAYITLAPRHLFEHP